LSTSSRGRFACTDLLEHVLDRAHHAQAILLLRRRVDHVQDEVGQPRLLQRRAERVDELVGSLRMKPTVSSAVGPAVEARHAGGRVERVEQPVAHADRGAVSALSSVDLPAFV